MVVIIAAIISVILFIVMSIFQLLLVARLPLGRFAFGGKHETLPKNLRIMSLIAIGIYVFASISVLVRVGIISFIPDSVVFIIAVWILAFFFIFKHTYKFSIREQIREASHDSTFAYISYLFIYSCYRSVKNFF